MNESPKSWWEIEPELRKAGWERDYDKGEVGLLTMIASTSGAKLVEEIGKEQAPDGYIRDGVYVALFDNSVGILVEYSAELPDWSDVTPGSPASVTYALLRRKAAA